MSVKYTEVMVAELKAIGTLDYDSAVAFGEKHDISPRSVIAKARALEIPYKAKVPGKKVVDKSPAKADLVKRVETAFGISAPSLAKCTVPDLLKIVAALG